MGTEIPKVVHLIQLENADNAVAMLHAFPTNKKDFFIVGTNRFFKFLRYSHVPKYSEELVEEIARTLKSRFAWLRVRHMTSEYTPVVKRREIKLELFDMRQQRNYVVNLEGEDRKFDQPRKKRAAQK